MNPCWKISLFEGARYVAITDFIFSATAILVITIQIITISIQEVDIQGFDGYFSVNSMLISYLSVSLVNFCLSIVLHRGIVTDDLQKCQTFLVISPLSTFFGFAVVIYHGLHWQYMPLSLFNSEFFVSLLYHLYKIYAFVVVIAFVLELRKLISEDEDATRRRRRVQYHSLESGNYEEKEPDEVAKYVFYKIPFSAKHVVLEEKLKIDYESCLDFEETTTTVKGILQQKTDKREVAVRILKNNFRMEKHMIELVKEAKLLFYIGNHQHILQLLGICCIAPDNARGNVMLVMENYVPKRLDEFLRSSFQNHLQNFVNLSSPGNSESRRSRRLGTVYENFETNYLETEPFSTMNMIQWAYQLSSGMEYLHSKKVVFGNLQAKSLMLINVSHVKLNDFAFASELWENNVVASSKVPGKVSWQWTAIECLSAANEGCLIEFNEKSDIWSYGTVLLEIFSVGQVPNISSNISEYISVLDKGNRPEKPDLASGGIYNIMKTCWSANPSDRPSFNLMTLFFRQVLTNSMQLTFN